MSLQTAHTHLVKTLYRQVIKLQLNWIVDRDLWHKQALLTRHKFEANKSLTDSGAINQKVKETQKWLKDHWHPDPYYIPTQQGGSSFQRNVAPPVECLLPPQMQAEAEGGHH